MKQASGNEDATREPRQRERLKAAHRHVACRLGVIFDENFLTSVRFAHKRRTDVRRHVTRLANLVGVVSAVNVAETYTRAMFELYARVARGENVRKAQLAAACVRRSTDPRWLIPPPSAPAQTAQPTETYTTKIYSLEGAQYLGSVTVEPGPVAEGEIAAARQPDGVWRLGKAMKVTQRSVTLERWNATRDREVFTMSQMLGKVVKIVTAEDEGQARIKGTTAETETRIRVLRSRLDNLDAPEDESARFRILREIYDLEHPKAEDSEEWPEYVDDRRAA